MGAPGLQRKFAKQQMQKVMGGDLVSDTETRQFNEKASTIAEQGLAAQQSALTRTQAAMAGGSPVASGAMAQSSQALGQAAGAAAVKASGQAQDMASALREKRKGEALGLASEMAERNQQAAEYALRATEVAGSITGLIPGLDGAVGAVTGG